MGGGAALNAASAGIPAYSQNLEFFFFDRVIYCTFKGKQTRLLPRAGYCGIGKWTCFDGPDLFHRGNIRRSFEPCCLHYFLGDWKVKIKMVSLLN